MSIVNSIETVRDWLTAEVCPLVKLKLPDDNATDASYPYKLVNPAAFSLFVPSKDRTPPNIAAPIPSVCVQIVQGDDDLLQSARDIKIRLCFSAWDPGYHGPDIFKPKGDGSGTYIQQYNEAAASYFVKNGEGWRDAWNFVDTALRLIENAEYLGDLRVIKEKGITFGPVTEQDAVPDFYPYWFAWAEFSVEETLTRNPKSYQHRFIQLGLHFLFLILNGLLVGGQRSNGVQGGKLGVLELLKGRFFIEGGRTTGVRVFLTGIRTSVEIRAFVATPIKFSTGASIFTLPVGNRSWQMKKLICMWKPGLTFRLISA